MKKFAEVVWVIEDIRRLEKENGWSGLTNEEAEEFFEKYGRYIQEMMITTGWEVMEHWLIEYRKEIREQEREAEHKRGFGQRLKREAYNGLGFWSEEYGE
jgi:hypothetical protein